MAFIFHSTKPNVSSAQVYAAPVSMLPSVSAVSKDLPSTMAQVCVLAPVKLASTKSSTLQQTALSVFHAIRTAKFARTI
jgi:hypothetical protein